MGVTSAFLAQDQLNAQFRDFAVNSQGEDNQLFQTTADILFDAYGFGSGVMPNAPWMPAAYNLGLANHQFNFPSPSDLGIHSAPPRPHPLVPPTPHNQPKDGKESPPMPNNQPKDGKEAVPMPQLLPLPQPQNDHNPNPEERKDNNAKEAAPEQARGDPAFEEALFTEPMSMWAAQGRPVDC